MKEKNSAQKSWSTKDWVNAYEENVRRIIKYQGFRVKPATLKYFEKMCNDRPEVNPYLWMKANFSPYREWRLPNKQGQWRVIKYPYPKMLNGENSRKHYQRLINQGITEVSSRRASIVKGVKASLERLKITHVSLDEYQRLWDMYVIHYVSPYILLLLKEMKVWITIKVRQGEVSMEEWKNLNSYEKILDSYENLNIELWRIIKENQ